MRHRWIRVDPALHMCRHCGMVRRTPGRVTRRYFYHQKNGQEIGWLAPETTPPCTKEWPKGWQPLGASLVRPDLFDNDHASKETP